MSQIILDKVISPSAPSIGSIALYVKSDGKLYIKDETGLESLVAASDISSLVSLDYVDFDVTTNIANSTGRLTWNNTDGTLNFGLKGGNVTLQIGQEQLVRVYNNTGTTLIDMQVVKLTGSSNQRLTVGLAQANTEINSRNTFAIVTEQIIQNNEGFATVSGLVRDLNTSSFSEGAPLYLSPTTPGGITTVKPVAPNHSILVGWCIKSHPSTGSIFVNIQNGYVLNELHDVSINSITNNDIIVWDSSVSLWKNKPISQIVTTTPTTLKTTNYVALITDYIIRADSSAGAITITLPTTIGNTGKSFVIKKIDASVNIVNIGTTLSQTIDGSTIIPIYDQYTAITVHCNGVSWDII